MFFLLDGREKIEREKNIEKKLYLKDKYFDQKYSKRIYKLQNRKNFLKKHEDVLMFPKQNTPPFSNTKAHHLPSLSSLSTNLQKKPFPSLPFTNQKNKNNKKTRKERALID